MNKKIRALLIGSYIWYFGAGLLGPLYTLFAEKIGGDILEITGAYAFYLIILGVLSIFIGKVSDHYSKKKLMIIGYIINTLATFGYLFVDNPSKLFIVQGMFGIAAALATPTWDALFSHYLDRKKEGEEWGYSDGGPSIITGVALFCGGLIITYFSFNVLFIFMGIIQIIATITQATFLISSRKKKSRPLKNKRVSSLYLI